MNPEPIKAPAPDVRPAAPPPAAPPAAEGAHGLHVVTGRSIREALLTARRSLGQRSIVVEHRTDSLGDGVARVTLAVSTEVPRSTEALGRLRADARRLLDADAKTRRSGPAAPVRLSSGRTPLADVERRLREHGGSKKLRERVLEGIVAASDAESHPLDLAAVEVGRAFTVASLPFVKGETTILALLGQTGAGKTTTLAKLSARLARAGRRVALATLDVARIGAAEQLTAYGDSIGVPAIALRDLDRFTTALRRDSSYDVILVDGSGDLVQDAASIQSIRDGLAARAGGLDSLTQRKAPRIEVLATLPANASRASLEQVIDSLAPLRPVGAVVTKIDETREPLPAMELAQESGLGLAFVTDGPDLATHFVRASAECFADIALTGRTSAAPRKGDAA